MAEIHAHHSAERRVFGVALFPPEMALARLLSSALGIISSSPLHLLLVPFLHRSLPNQNF